MSESFKDIPKWVFVFVASSLIIILIFSLATDRSVRLFGEEFGVSGPPITDTDSMPHGVILAWYSKEGAIPSGWAICDGTNGTPDLRGRFLRGVASMAEVGGKGGLDRVLDGSTGDHSITLEEMPSHSHLQTLSGGVGSETGYVHTEGQLWGPTNIAGGKKTQPEGESRAHTHPLRGFDNKPLYRDVLFIMKVR
jgi:hypothetical protein